MIVGSTASAMSTSALLASGVVLPLSLSWLPILGSVHRRCSFRLQENARDANCHLFDAQSRYRNSMRALEVLCAVVIGESERQWRVLPAVLDATSSACSNCTSSYRTILPFTSLLPQQHTPA